jgi:hypothetical protein
MGLGEEILMSEKGLYIGAGAGIILFAVIGLLPGSFIGGAIGVNIATKLFGSPLEASLLPKLVVVAAMAVGTLAAGLVFVVGTSSVGWLIGSLLDTTLCGRTMDKEAVVKNKWDGR